MSSLNFGRRKDRDVEEYFIKEVDEDSDIMEEKRDIMEAEEDNVSDYIDPDDLNYSDYDDIVDTIENNGWTHVALNPMTLSNIDIVFPRPIKANSSGTILSIVCPTNRIITICGINDCNVDIDDFHKYYNLYTTPHFFTLSCKDDNNVEISPTTIISILKCKMDEEPEAFYQAFYGDLSPADNGKLKKKHERYYFGETIILQRGEKLIFIANNPNVDISRIELFMMSDLFEKDEE